jgi:hypothetical protein
MPLRFWRRVLIILGLRVNLSKSGQSLSVGRRGAVVHYRTARYGPISHGAIAASYNYTNCCTYTASADANASRSLTVLAGLAMLVWANVAASH